MVGMGTQHREEHGASLVEFALIMPLLVLLIFGMVDAGWAFSQNLEVRHGAREGARLAAVSNPYTTPAAIIAETCTRMTSTGDSDVSIQLSLPSGSLTGDSALITVTRNHSALTGFLPFFDSIQLSSTVEIRLERNASWAPGDWRYCDGSVAP